MARPLTKLDGTGKLYVRPPAIEVKIDAAFAQGWANFPARAAVRDCDSPEYLESECLVHLVRDAHRRNDQGSVSALFPALLSRCEEILRNKIPDSPQFDAADIREEVLGQFAELFAIDGSGADLGVLDYFECRFNRAFRALRIDVVRSESTRLSRIARIPDRSEETEAEVDSEDVWARVSEAFRTPPTQLNIIFRNELRHAINALPANERQAIVMCHVLGYKVESTNPAEETAATRCRVSGRTIRSRLSRAAASLQRFKKDA